MVALGTTAPPSAPTPAAGSSAPSTAGWFALIIVGSLLALIGGASFGSTAWLTGSIAPRFDDGFLHSRDASIVAPVNAVTTSPAEIDTSLDLDQFPRINVSLRAGEDGGQPVFVGIGPSADVAQYLEGVHIAEASGIGGATATVTTRDIAGSTQPEPPNDQSFWVASDSGPGIREFTWLIQPGEWTAVIMNVDGTVGIDTSVSAGIEAPWVAPVVATILLVTAGIVLIGVALIIVGAFGWGRGRMPEAAPRVGYYPARLTGELRGTPSRWLWLLKWILIIPHWIVLSLLWVALVVTTVVAGIAILFTGRYPRGLFDFNVGVLRWSWRVSFYAYSALGTDRYPPFTLERTDYPADFDVVYPERMSHGLVLVKSWLLALPHLLIVSVLTGSAGWGATWLWGASNSNGTGVSLLGLLVVVAGVILLFSGRYQQPIFDLIMGINRWAYRVATYVVLMRDEYPPFRLDTGATEPDGPDTLSPELFTTTVPSPDGAGR